MFICISAARLGELLTEHCASDLIQQHELTSLLLMLRQLLMSCIVEIARHGQCAVSKALPVNIETLHADTGMLAGIFCGCACLNYRKV